MKTLFDTRCEASEAVSSLMRFCLDNSSKLISADSAESYAILRELKDRYKKAKFKLRVLTDELCEEEYDKIEKEEDVNAD